MVQTPARQSLNPPTLVTPKNPYSQLVSVTGAAALVTVSGQLGVDRDGRFAEDFASQVRRAIENVKAALAATGMGLEDVMHLRHYLVAGEDIAVFNRERIAILGDLRPASTLIFASGLAHPDALYEVDAVAAR